MPRKHSHEAPPAVTAGMRKGHGDSRTPERRILPRDLDAALTYLTDDELKRLMEAVKAEARRRLPESPGGAAPPPARTATKKTPPQTAVSLTKSQVNLIRSSIKAGVKPRVLARQFGLTQAQIKAALSDE